MNCVYRIIKENFRILFHSSRFLLGILIGFSVSVDSLYKLYTFSLIRMEPLNNLEGFIYIAIDPQNAMFPILGLLLWVSNAPFLDERVSQMVIRSNRKNWNIANILFILLQIILYYTLYFAITVLFIGKQGYWGTEWSIPMIQTAENTLIISQKYQVYFPYIDFLSEHDVIHAFLLSFSGNCFYAMTLTYILYAGNLGQNVTWGTWTAIMVHFLGYITRKEFHPELSLASYASFAENYSFFPFLIIIPIIAFTFIRIKSMDICYKLSH